MDVLTRNHSISKAIRRQTLVQNFSPLQVSYDCFLLFILVLMSLLSLNG